MLEHKTVKKIQAETEKYPEGQATICNSLRVEFSAA